MAGSSVIGALRVVIGADSAALDKGLADAQGRLSAFGSGVAKAGAVAAASFVAAGAAIGVAVKHAIDSADNLGKAAQKVGVPVEELSALKFAAELSDVSLESLTKSMGKLSKTMVEAAAKPTSEAALAFKALGVSVTDSDGKLKTSSQVMGDVAGKFEGLKDGAGKTAVSMALFGKTGAELIPLLNAGKDGIEEMKNEAAALGLVIDTQTAKAAEDFNDNLKRLGAVKDGIILKITAGMLPALKNLSANMVLAAKDGDLLTATGVSLGDMMTGLVGFVARLSLAFNRIGVEWRALKEFLTTPLSTASWEKFNAAGEESMRQLAALRITMETAHLADAFGPVAEKTKTAAKAQQDFNFHALAGKTAVDSFIDSTNKSLATQQAEIATFGMAAGAKERLRIVMQGLLIAQQNQIPLTEMLRLKLSELGFAAEQAALKMAGLQLTQDTMTASETFSQQLTRNKQLLDAGAISAETYGRANQQAAERAGATWDIAGASMAGSFQKIAQSFGKESSGMAKAAKAFGIVQSLISMYTGAAKALELPFPANLAAMAAVLATGASLVASVRSQTVPGFQTGGSFRVGGGMGGGDSKLMQFMAEPGEMVDVRRGGGAGESREITVRGLNLTDIFSGKQVVELLNEAIGDGSRLRLAAV